MDRPNDRLGLNKVKNRPLPSTYCIKRGYYRVNNCYTTRLIMADTDYTKKLYNMKKLILFQKNYTT